MNIKKLVKSVFIILIFFTTQLIAEKKIIIASSEHEPYIGKNLPNQGYVYELIKEAFKESGYKVELKYFPLIRAKKVLEYGRVDAYAPANEKDFSKKDFSFSLPFAGDNIGLLKKKSLVIEDLEKSIQNPQKLFRDLESYSFGALRGLKGIPVFDDADFLKKEMVSKDIQNIDKLFFNRIDFAVIDKYKASDIIVRHRPHMIGKLEFVNPALIKKDFHLVFSKKTKDYKQKLKDFNKGLKSLKEKGKVDEILSKHGLLPTRKKNEEKTKIVVGTVNNNDMLIMQKLSSYYEKEKPNIEIEWKVLDENILRKRLLSDMAISDGEFDVVTIGAYEAPTWAEKKWLVPLDNISKEYDLKDVLKPLRQSLLYGNKLYALPFYGESSMTYYRKDLFEKAGIKMPKNPTYKEIMKFAKKIHDPKNEIYGICLRGKAGWGSNMAYFNTLLNSFGAIWFDENWKPKIDSMEWRNALNFYKELVTKYGPKSTPLNNFNENKKLFSNGHCGIWIDATVAASELFNPKKSKVYKSIAYANAPKNLERESSSWLWIWSLAIPSSSKNKKEAQDFITWATSKNYIELVAKNYGWLLVPPGTRTSTYENINYKNAAPFSEFVYSSINSVERKDTQGKKRFYSGVQFISIPEYSSLGDRVGLLVQQVIENKISVDEALKNAQSIVNRQMIQSGYIK